MWIGGWGCEKRKGRGIEEYLVDYELINEYLVDNEWV
jgi:hypothetical protein